MPTILTQRSLTLFRLHEHYTFIRRNRYQFDNKKFWFQAKALEVVSCQGVKKIDFRLRLMIQQIW